jgi:hypothetical protein
MATENTIEILPSDRTTKVPYGFKGEKITIEEMIKTKEFTSLEPVFARRILSLIRDNPSVGILKGGGGRDEEQVRNLFYANYKKIPNAPDYENDPAKYEDIKSGKIKWNPEDNQWYKRVTSKTVAVPGASWHTGGYAVDFTGNIDLAGKVAEKYQLEQITGTGETHHFQPLGVPISKRMFLELKNTYGIDAIKTPLSRDILLYINKEIASNVPRHPARIKKVLDAAIAKFKLSSGTNDDAVARERVLTNVGRLDSGITIDWGKVSTATPTTVAKALTTTTTSVPATTTRSTVGGVGRIPGVNATTTTLPDLPNPSGKETPQGKKTRLMADWVMNRSDALVKTGVTRQQADKQALKDVSTQFGKQDASIVPTTSVPKSTVSIAPPPTLAPTTTTMPRGTTTTVPKTNTTTPTTSTTVPAGQFDLEAPGAAKKQLDSAIAAKPDPKTKMYNILGYGMATKQQRIDLINSLRDTLASQQVFDLEAPGAAKKQYDSAVKSKPDAITGKYFIVGFGWATKAERDNIIASTKPGSTDAPDAPDAPGKDGKTPAATTVVVDGKKVKVGGDKWKQIIQEEFGSLWDIYNDNADVKKVVDKSVAEGWYNDTVKLDASLKNTNWYRTTQSSVRQYTINKSTDPATHEATINQTVASLRANTLASGVVLSDTTLRTLAENQLKYKWSEQQTANAIGSETVSTARRGGPQAVADLRKGAVGTGLRAIADNYAQKPTDTMLDMWVAEVMQGTKTQEQFTDLMKQQASTQYRSLAPLIEKGQDVKTAVSMYTNTAQNVLGVDPNTVDWSQDKWNKALNYQDPKTNEYRQMDSWEWNRYLRSLPEWQETDDAKRTYRSAAFTLAQAFGKTS